MKKCVIAVAGLLASTLVLADNLSKADRLLCATNQVQICFETGECYSTLSWEADVPQFVVIDMKGKVMSTTKASEENRSTPIATLTRKDGKIIVQGSENERAFSVVIDEAIGAFTAAIARDGISVSVFGSCTDSERI